MSARVTALACAALVAAWSGDAGAALFGRLPATPGGTDYRAVYDTDLDVTWLADATPAATHTFGVPGILSGGRMDWYTAQTWIAAMNAAAYLGASDWRLPATTQPDPGCSSQSFVGASFPLQGYGLGCTASEMGHLFYAELGGVAGSPINLVHNASYALFTNLQNNDTIWSATSYVTNAGNAWYFAFDGGTQGTSDKNGFGLYGWALRPGDIDADGDGVGAGVDNCLAVANPDQKDADGDGYGNACDADLDNNGTVTATDFALLRSVLGQPASFGALAAAADLDGNGTVTATDFAMLRKALGGNPGPSGYHPNCPPICP